MKSDLIFEFSCVFCRYVETKSIMEGLLIVPKCFTGVSLVASKQRYLLKQYEIVKNLLFREWPSDIQKQST